MYKLFFFIGEIEVGRVERKKDFYKIFNFCVFWK